MSQYFNFRRLIEKYSSDFIAEIPPEGFYDDGGDWVIGTPKKFKLRGAIISHRESKIFKSEGALTGQDRALYMLEPIDNAIQMAKIIFENRVYSIGDLLENSKFTGVWAYTLKFVSAFKENPANFDITEELDKLEDRLDGVVSHSEEPITEPTVTDRLTALEKRLDGVDDD